MVADIAFPLVHPTLESKTSSDDEKRKPLDVDGCVVCLMSS